MDAHLARRLRTVLAPPIMELLDIVATAAERLGMPLYVVGGLPRDLLLGIASHDLDLVAEGDATVLARALVASHGGSVTVHRRFGTATWQRGETSKQRGYPDSELNSVPSVDLITARTETYSRPGQLPHVRTGTIEDDLRRRDFTINAIAIRLDGRHFGQVLDPLHGIDDVLHRRVRVMHTGSFVDDPTRMYRAVRYEQRLGFGIDGKTRSLISTGSPSLLAVSGVRLRRELDLILQEDRAVPMLRRLSRMGLITRIHSSLPTDARSLRRLERGRGFDPDEKPEASRGSALERKWGLWLMDLSATALRAVGRRLDFDKRRVELLLATAELYRRSGTWAQWKHSRLARHLDKMPEQAVMIVKEALPAGRERQALYHYLVSWRHMRPHTSGKDLRELGLQPGPRFRAILDALRAAWIDGEVEDVQGERLLLRRLIERSASSKRSGRAKMAAPTDGNRRRQRP